MPCGAPWYLNALGGHLDCGRFLGLLLRGPSRSTALHASRIVECYDGGATSRIEAMRHCLLELFLRMVVTIVAILSPAAALAGGTCLLHPEPFKLQSDTVRWSIRISSGGECIQGLRWSTIMIENISVTEQPKSGQVLVQGPSFRYFSNPGVRGTDSFKISISGTSLRVSGTSSIEVDVTSQ